MDHARQESASLTPRRDGRASRERPKPVPLYASAIIGEGATEVGFASALLEAALAARLEQYGVHLSDGGGHENTLDVLQASG